MSVKTKTTIVLKNGKFLPRKAKGKVTGYDCEGMFNVDFGKYGVWTVHKSFLGVYSGS